MVCRPNLASQHRQYLYSQLMACRDGGRSHRRWTFSPVKMSRDELQAIVLFDTVVALSLVQVGRPGLAPTALFERENIGDDIYPLIGFEHDVGHGVVRRTERRGQCDCCHPGSGRHDLEGRCILVGRSRLSLLHSMTLSAEALGRSKATARLTDLLRFAVSWGIANAITAASKTCFPFMSIRPPFSRAGE